MVDQTMPTLLEQVGQLRSWSVWRTAKGESIATVRSTADSASQAAQIAGSNTLVAHAGGEMIRQMVQTMEQMNSASRKIGEIVGTIDGIAFQTNIWALNAAVEAARAGEQGRGFAVVAAQVRAPALRCSDASREIRTLITASVERGKSKGLS